MSSDSFGHSLLQSLEEEVDDAVTERTGLLDRPDALGRRCASETIESTSNSLSDHSGLSRRSLFHRRISDPRVARRLKNAAFRGSTLLLLQYHAQRRKAEEAAARERQTSSSLQEEEISERKPERQPSFLLKHIQSNFVEDAASLAEGTIPQSIVLALCIGTLCGICCYVYYTVLNFLLDLLWKRMPEWFVIPTGWWTPEFYWVWIPLVVFVMAIGVGLSVVYLGEPGDLAFTIHMVHDKGFIPTDHVIPMAAASLFSILGGGSLGPEAPLVAICGAIGGWVSRDVFKQQRRNVVRKHTFMGMAGALAAFFGVPLGGSLFALEVVSRFGVEFYEHMVEAIFCGEICLVVFRTLGRLSIAPIWKLADTRLWESSPVDVLIGGAIGLCGAGMAVVFASFHWRLMDLMAAANLLDNERAVWRAQVGAVVIAAVGVCIPATLFWGEEEFEMIATMGPSSELPHVFPTGGAFNFEMDTWWRALLLGFAKLICISFTVAGGFRGGFIFPFFATGAAFGQVLKAIFPQLPNQLATLCFAAGINVAITRTSLATTLILAFLSGEPCATPAILMASLCSLFATSYMTFLKSQIARSDMDHTLYHHAGNNMHGGRTGVPRARLGDDSDNAGNGNDLIGACKH